VYVRPRSRLYRDLEGLGVSQGLRKVGGLKGVDRPIGCRPKTGHDLECEVPGCGEWFSRWLGSEGGTGRDASRPRIGNPVDDDRRVDDHEAGR